ncbi:hypothetical protein CFP56_040096 [Quercus suber]|uniref:Uncharacterized protein n=1 Tax=Quercus suber TaxID=58331 RepID=A0AAW0LMN7_QUESU
MVSEQRDNSASGSGIPSAHQATTVMAATSDNPSSNPVTSIDSNPSGSSDLVLAPTSSPSFCPRKSTRPHNPPAYLTDYSCKAVVSKPASGFHAKEYPAYDKEVFPYNMGFCQKGSNVKYDDSMNLRNILWLAPLPSNSTKAWVAPGVLVVLDACPEGIIYRDLISEYVNFARTIYEDDLGDVAVDVNYLDVGAAIPDYQIFIC